MASRKWLLDRKTRGSRAITPIYTRPRDLSRIDRRIYIHVEVSLWGEEKKRRKDWKVRRLSLSLSLRKSKQRRKRGIYTRMNSRHAQLYITFHYLGRCPALLLYAIRYVSTRVFAYSSRMSPIIFHVRVVRVNTAGPLIRSIRAASKFCFIGFLATIADSNKFARC